MLFRNIYLIALLTAAVSTVDSPLHAQQKNPPPTVPRPAQKPLRASIAGVVIDSVNGRFLSGAEVVVEGANISLTTDSSGRFKVDSVPPGTYQVGVFHPLLDTLGVSLATAPFHLGPDSSTFIALAIPSSETLIKRACPVVGPRAQGTSAIIGRVTDPESLQPVTGADVSIAWLQIEVSKEIGLRRTPRVLRDSTDAQGQFKICGVPNSMQATLQARKGGAVTAEIPITLGEEPSELFARTLLLSRADSGAKTGNAVVSGRVVLEGAASNAGSRVEVVGTDQIAMTNEKGEFTMRNLPSGSQVLLARHLGFGAEVIPVDLSSREPKQVSIKLPKYVAIIDPVVVTARRAASLDKVGFTQRQKSGTGFYMGPEQIQSMHPQYLTDILRRVPSLRIQSSPTGDVVTSSRGVTSFSGSGCVQYFLDDMPWMSATPGDINQFVNGSEVVGVEVYAGPGAPAQYTRGMQDCTTVVLWTKFKIRDLGTGNR